MVSFNRITNSTFLTSAFFPQRIENQHKLSDELDFVESDLLLSSEKQTKVKIQACTGSATEVRSLVFHSLTFLFCAKRRKLSIPG